MDELKDTFPILNYRGEKFVPVIRDKRFRHDVSISCGNKLCRLNKRVNPENVIITYVEEKKHMKELLSILFGSPILPSSLSK